MKRNTQVRRSFHTGRSSTRLDCAGCDERSDEPLEEVAAQRSLADEELLIIDPERFQNGKDGPCHTPEFRKRFWTDVLRSLELSFDLLADEARAFNQERLRFMPDEYIHDLEARIATLYAEL